MLTAASGLQTAHAGVGLSFPRPRSFLVTLGVRGRCFLLARCAVRGGEAIFLASWAFVAVLWL
jgi:hypothetical protein